MTIAGMITMVLSIGAVWGLFLLCALRLWRHDRAVQRQERGEGEDARS